MTSAAIQQINNNNNNNNNKLATADEVGRKHGCIDSKPMAMTWTGKSIIIDSYGSI